MTTVSDRLHKRIERDFPQPGSADDVARLVAEASDSERIQAAIVFKSHGDIREVRRQVDLVAVDWRDVLMYSGLEHDGWPSVLDSRLGD